MKAVIALNQIDKIEIYQNIHRYYKNKIKILTGADYILNGAFFSNNYRPLQTLKINDKLLVKDPKYDYYGYGWNIGPDIKLINDCSNFKNFICCINGLKDGVCQTMYYNKDVAGYRPRSAIGLSKESLVLYCDKLGKTPEQVRDILKSMECLSMICLDGGGSTQGDFNGVKVNSSENNWNGRICYSYILIYLKKTNNYDNEKCLYDEPSYIIKYKSQGEGVKWVQWHLNNHGMKLSIDGSFGPSTVMALQKFQRSRGIEVDGVCGPITRKKLKEM